MKNEEHKYTFKMLKLDDILKTDNIRKITDLSDLKASIKEHGIINPVTVIPIDGGYQLLAGFRRCAAANELGMDKVPCHVYESDSSAVKEIPVTENITRMDMTPAEECLAVAHLIGKKNTPKQVAKKFGRSLRWVLVRTKIAGAGDKAIKMLEEGDLNISAAMKLANLPDEDFNKAIEEHGRIDDYTVSEILEHYQMDLEKAPFDHEKCLKCEKCSACQCDLFENEPKAYCLDPECFQKKMRAHAKKIVKDLVAEGKNARIGKINKWGMDADDEAYDYKISSYMDDYKKAEEAGIPKRILVNENTCETYEYYDCRDLPDYHEETDEEREARLEAEQKERDMNGIRQNMYKDRLQESIEKVCRNNTDALITLMWLNTDCCEDSLTEDVQKKFGLGTDEDGYDKSIWDINLDLPLPEIVKGIKDSLEEQFGNIYYNTNRMEYVYKLICAKDPSKFMPSEKDVKKEYDRKKKEEAKEKEKSENTEDSQ